VTRAVLVALAMLAAMPAAVAACGCCPEPGEWSQSSRKATAEELAEVGRLNFATEARVYLAAAGLDGVRGITRPSPRYTVRHRRPHREWTLELTDDRGARGSLRFVIPDRLEAYSVDLHHGKQNTTVLYKEWRFAGPVTTQGDFRGAQFRLVLQGRGTACPDADQFKSWVLQVTGGGADYALFGELDATDGRLGMAPPLHFISPSEAVRLITDLLRREDWPTLARYYDLDGTSIPRDALTSGRFFVHSTRPPAAHPGLPWQYRHPFTPGFTFTEARVTPASDVVIVVVGIAIDEGDGRVRRGFSEFRMRKSAAGYRVLPE
jgi:hypothetical protein